MTKTLIETTFHNGFSLKHDGKIRRFGCCQYHDDPSWEVIEEDGKVWLVKQGSRDEGFAERRREPLALEAMVTHGYHDDEHGEWKSVGEMVLAVEDAG